MRTVSILIAIPIIAFGALYIFFSSEWSQKNGSIAGNELKTVQIGGVPVSVTVVDTPEERTQGLSGRAGLAQDEGMLFVFPKDGDHGFWMKDMLFSIDIVWLSAEKKVVYIEEGVSPLSYPRSFKPTAPARYVLELPAGFVKAYTVDVGSLATW
ncbi:MAG: hypothetical protein G01um10148_410 [Parcubacteria group bacterium Gr01-1014_8]|nr:MAG: hypothetical protein G01um10148_410 [Parcubacteria group bacterium Gr01-1014_8]